MSWNTVTPNKASGSSKKIQSTARFTSILKPSKPHNVQSYRAPLVGRWPEAILLHIFQYLPIPDVPQVARCSRAFSRLVRADSGWEWRCDVLHLSKNVARDDDFGDFSASTDVFEDVDFGELAAKKSYLNTSKASARPGEVIGHLTSSPASSHYSIYKNYHQSLLPLCRHLRSSSSPSSTLALLFPSTKTLLAQATTLLALLRFLSPTLQPLRDWGFLRQALVAAADRFDSSCLVAFEMADAKNDEAAMRSSAESSWKVWDAGGGGRDQWECGRVWVEKREVFYETGKWDPLENVVYVRLWTSS
jgi:recyclin-1